MERRKFLALSAQAMAGLGIGTLTARAQSSSVPGNQLDQALERFRALRGKTSYVIEVAGADLVRPWRAEHRPDQLLFVGSAVKAFILTKYLQLVERDLLSEEESLPIDDGVRSLSSPIFMDLSGKTPARHVLEGMISHSDNTATDASLLKARVQRVRRFIASAGLTKTKIPDSTRIMFSYLAGAAPGVDVGWEGMKKILDGKFFGQPRFPVNDSQTMISTANEFVSFYSRALKGEFFSEPATLVEFKRILAMADIIARVVPPDTAAFAKGGSIDWQDFHAVCGPGQMVVCGKPVTFCFTLNWEGPDDGVPAMLNMYAGIVADALAAVADANKPSGG